METATRLRKFIDVLIGLLSLSLLVSVFVLFYIIIQKSTIIIDMPERYQSVDLFSWKTYIILVSFAVEYILCILALFYMRSGVKKLSLGKFFTTEISQCFLKSGKLFVIVGLTTIFLRFLADLILLDRIGIIIDYTNISLVFVSVVGLFFMLFSNVLYKGIELKKDNDLTI
ncbi:DUF2975 domain-containing protein [Winogradskyella bathintestinalis]|uniref:DUF2975 domain-containing protein n=1 Tax=Winogradskyella bathintestinalis TaxID=3035208 RepID=A0ABT7ZS17_9FLAO|nr:DUF2975 domain-containing protein [Winogradskyella bathintestinalis]MDN3491778.1 DUF2975 domain-containing protein [Winogradskyella bathintestinalis]